MINLNAKGLNQLFTDIIKNKINDVTFQDERESYCIKQYLDGRSLVDIGNEIKLTRERVRQIIIKGLQKI